MSKIPLCQRFEEHLGSYEHSMAVGMLGRGLVPAQPENGEWAWKQRDPAPSPQELRRSMMRMMSLHSLSLTG